jgi:colicin import membrane protein
MTIPEYKKTVKPERQRKLRFRTRDRKFLVGSLLLHVVLLVLLLVSWQSRESVKAVQLPASIQARVLNADELAALRDKREQEQRQIEDKKKKELIVKEKAAKKLAEQKRQKETKRRKEEARKKAQILEKKRKEEKRRKDKELQKKKQQEKKALKEKQRRERQEQAQQKKQAERERRLLEKMQEIESQEAERQRQLQAERRARQLELEQQQALANELSETERFMALIRSRIESKWHIPPNSRKLTVVLRIRLLPTGELSAVKLLESSGQSAMDQSALSAVNSIRLFPVPKDRVIFEKYFRQFSMSFTPEL